MGTRSPFEVWQLGCCEDKGRAHIGTSLVLVCRTGFQSPAPLCFDPYNPMSQALLVMKERPGGVRAMENVTP